MCTWCRKLKNIGTTKRHRLKWIKTKPWILDNFPFSSQLVAMCYYWNKVGYNDKLHFYGKSIFPSRKLFSIKKPNSSNLLKILVEICIILNVYVIKLSIRITFWSQPVSSLGWLEVWPYALREKCQNSEFFWSVFFRILIEYGPEKLRI